MIESGSLAQAENWNLEPATLVSGEPALLQLPLEVLMMILKLLPPSSLISFFGSSKAALSFANRFCRQGQLQFYHFTDTAGGDLDNRLLMLTMLSHISHGRHHGLDKRWELVSNVKCLRQHALSIDGNLTMSTTSVPAP